MHISMELLICLTLINSVYNLDDTNDEVSYSDYKDSESIKRLGISGLLYYNPWSSQELATGIYQGGLTARVNFTT
jgi:hypothetical protein